MAKLSEMKTPNDVERLLPNMYSHYVGRLPGGSQWGMAAWVFFGKHIVGDFCHAVLMNQLVEAFGRADSTNTYMMPTYATWLYNDAPGGSWGSKGNMDDWAETGGIFGRVISNRTPEDPAADPDIKDYPESARRTEGQR